MTCPYFKHDICNITKDPPAENYFKRFCPNDEKQYSKCPYFKFKQTHSNQVFDLRNIYPTTLYDGLRKLSISNIVNLIIQQMITTLSDCQKCKSISKSQSSNKSKLCFEHEFYIQKISFALQDIHGFNSNSPIPFKPLTHGPFSTRINKSLSQQHVLSKWKDSKTIAQKLNQTDSNMLTNLIQSYLKMPINDLEVLMTMQYEQLSKTTTEQNKIIEDLKEKYKDPQIFEKEVKLFEKPLLDTLKEFEQTFEAVEPLGIGSSGILIKLKDKHLGNKENGIFRVLKFPRPREKEFRISNLKIIQEERDLLCSLSHDRIVKVILAGETEFDGMQLPWYIMEYIGPSNNLSDYLENETKKSLDINSITKIIEDISAAVKYLHKKGIVHCDIKSDNVLIKMEDRPIAMLTDLGYARAQKGNPDEKIAVRFDIANAHPFLKTQIEGTSDPAAVTAKITRKDLDTNFDLHALGMTIKRIFDDVMKNFEENNIQHDYNDENYEYRYLKLLMCRLIYAGSYPSLSGKPNDLPVLERYVHGLTDETLVELAYKNSFELVEDIDKLHNTSLESWIPELNPSFLDVISLGAKETRVVLTERLKKMLEHPDFDRLGAISQLALILFVYPRGKHARLEHALGTYAHTCEYVRALWYNAHDPLFRSIMKKEDLYSVLLAALLHDVGYYPMAHELEDCRNWRNSGIRHEKYSCNIIIDILSKQIKENWGVVPEKVKKLIEGSNLSFKESILHSIIDGPIDADKLDYLLRDGEHLGLPYPQGIDKQWFLRNLTIAYDSLIQPAIAVTDKGRVSAELIASIRHSMFSVAYWHHTVRSIKAMLRYAVDNLNEGKSFNEQEHFEWFQKLPYIKPKFELVKNAMKRITYTDYLQLCWVREKLNDEGKNLIDLILQRKLFKRILVLDGSSQKSKSTYENIIQAQDDDIENIRKSIDQKIRNLLADSGIKEISSLKPLVLIDVPRVRNEANPLYVVTENESKPLSQISSIWKQLVDQFSQSIIKVRIFVHPEIFSFIKQTIPKNELYRLVSQAVESHAGYGRQ